MNTKTDNKSSITSAILNYLLQLIGLAVFYWLLLYTTINYWFHGFIYKLAKLRYEAGPNFTKELYLILLIFAVFCYLANRFVLDLYHRNTALQLIISIVVDYLLWPMQVFIMLIYNNTHMTFVVKDITTLVNVFVLTGLLVLKTLIAVKLLSRKTASAEEVNYKTK